MPRHRTWTDDSLCIAVAASRSWKDVCESLAVPVGGKTVNSLRRRADELGLDYKQFYAGGRRGKRISEITDDHLRQLVGLATSWSDLSQRMGYVTCIRGGRRSRLAQRVEDLGLSIGHFRELGYNGLTSFAAGPVVFAAPDPRRLRFAAIGRAIAWFAERGCVVSTPVEPAVYDLLVDAGPEDLYKVQVKSSTSAQREVGFSRSGYDNTRPNRTSAGFVRRTPYTPGDVDYFFVVLGDGSLYLIPYDVIGQRLSARLGARYDGFKVG